MVSFPWIHPYLRFPMTKHSLVQILLLLQKPLIQSDDWSHVFVSAHFGHLIPPQSISVSSWFLTPSSHDPDAEVKTLVMSDIHKDTILTTTRIVFARAADTIWWLITCLRICTLWTFDTTTVNIRLILIFDSVVTWSRCWSERTCHAWDSQRYNTHDHTYCFCKSRWYSRNQPCKSFVSYILDTWYHHSQYQFHLDFSCDPYNGKSDATLDCAVLHFL